MRNHVKFEKMEQSNYDIIEPNSALSIKESWDNFSEWGPPGQILRVEELVFPQGAVGQIGRKLG